MRLPVLPSPSPCPEPSFSHPQYLRQRPTPPTLTCPITSILPHSRSQSLLSSSPFFPCLTANLSLHLLHAAPSPPAFSLPSILTCPIVTFLPYPTANLSLYPLRSPPSPPVTSPSPFVPSLSHFVTILYPHHSTACIPSPLSGSHLVPFTLLLRISPKDLDVSCSPSHAPRHTPHLAPVIFDTSTGELTKANSRALCYVYIF